jgi:predicted transcriptional regulator
MQVFKELQAKLQDILKAVKGIVVTHKKGKGSVMGWTLSDSSHSSHNIYLQLAI